MRATKGSLPPLEPASRVRRFLDDIYEIVVERPQDVGTGYELLREGVLEDSVDAFVEAKQLYETIVRPATGIDPLNQLEVVVKELSTLNRGLAFFGSANEAIGRREIRQAL